MAPLDLDPLLFSSGPGATPRRGFALDGVALLRRRLLSPMGRCRTPARSEYVGALHACAILVSEADKLFCNNVTKRLFFGKIIHTRRALKKGGFIVTFFSRSFVVVLLL